MAATGSVRLTARIGIGVLTRLVPRDLIDEILTETGRREKRSRLLPAHVVVYFVMAMAVFRDGYEEVMRRLTGGLQSMRAWHEEWAVPTTGAISQTRDRLGEAPLKHASNRVRQASYSVGLSRSRRMSRFPRPDGDPPSVRSPPVHR
jgi:hypothetical protein